MASVTANAYPVELTKSWGPLHSQHVNVPLGTPGDAALSQGVGYL